jgi:mersacidin/lichenicidin family type 2 lantibiotic
MSHNQIVRAWKDVEYRQSLSEEQRSQVPVHPAGMLKLSDSDLDFVAGGLDLTSYGTVCSLGYRCILNTTRCNTV